MTKYKRKYCGVCGKLFTPTSPNQKYCIDCKDEGRRIVTRIRDRKKSRIKNNYTEYTRNCLACGVQFSTYYSKKRFCGTVECNKIRLCRKNERIQARRSKEFERLRAMQYYESNKLLCRYRKAVKQRELNPDMVEYSPRGFHRHSTSYVRQYVKRYGYRLLSNRYINNTSKIKLLCPSGHEWETNFHNFKDNGARCLYCYIENNYTSKPEQKLLDYFRDNYPLSCIIHNDRSQIAPLEIDLYFPDQKLGVEVCGLYWHSEVSGKKNRSYHYDKMIKCYEKGIRLITVFEDEIRDKFDIVVSRVLQALSLTDKKIFARKCKIKQINTKLANLFFDKYHIQGKTQSTVAWGLFYKDELVGVCSIGKFVRQHTCKLGSIELKRFCSKNNVFVVGGFSKLFNQVVKYCYDNGYTDIKSYCDMRYANIFNPVYELFGFKLNGYTKYTPHYIKGGTRYRNFSLRKTVAERETGKTEFELRLAQGYDRIWDCGHRTYVYEV